jgi:hypothetical protein
VNEDLLSSKSLHTRGTSDAIFGILDGFIKDSNIDWSKCVRISTEGARALRGRCSGVVARVKAVSPQAKSIHCRIHTESEATKKMPAELRTVLEESVKAVNFIKVRPLNSRIFAAFCEEMGSDHRQLLPHTEVLAFSGEGFHSPIRVAR